MTLTARELQISPVADAVDLPIEGPLLPAPVARFLANVAQRLLPWAVPVGLIVLWQIASSQGWLSARVLPAPVDVLKAAWTLAASGELWTHVKVSAGRALAGLAVGVAWACCWACSPARSSCSKRCSTPPSRWCATSLRWRLSRW